MKLFKIAKRVFSTKIATLLNRPDLNNLYPYEFMRKMSENEIKVFLNEIREMLRIEEISTKNINRYNKVFNCVVEERESIYQEFKLIGVDNYDEKF